MSRDYYSCNQCDFGFDSEDGCYCDCGKRFCSIKCGEMKNILSQKEIEKIYFEGSDIETIEHMEGGDYSKDHKFPITCCFCRKEESTDADLLKALLKHYQITREQAFEIYKKQG